MLRFLVLAAVGMLWLTACGSDSVSELSLDQERVVELVMEASGAEGLTYNERCLRDVISRMSPDDAKLFADSQLSQMGDGASQYGEEMVTCLDRDEFIDYLINFRYSTQTGGPLPGVNVDRNCIAESKVLADVEISEIMSGGVPPEVLDAIDACVTLAGSGK